MTRRRRRRLPPSDPTACAYCRRGVNRDCRRRCPTRRCPTCGGAGAVPDLESPVSADAELPPHVAHATAGADGRVYHVKPCPAGCRRSRLVRWLPRVPRFLDRMST